MIDLNITLRAKNSSGNQELSLASDNGEYWFTLCGEYEGKKIQIDFDEMTRSDLLDLKTMIDLVIESV